MDHSFVVLPKQKNQVPGVPPRPRGGAIQPDTSQSGKAMEESFVVLPPPAASVYKCESASDAGGIQVPSHEGGPGSAPLHPNNSGFHSTITVLKRAFDIATTQTQVCRFGVGFLCQGNLTTTKNSLLVCLIYILMLQVGVSM